MKNTKNIIKLFAFSAFVFSVTMTCMPFNSKANDNDDQIAAYKQYYQFKMQLHVPRVYDNTKSLGYRKYQTQTIKGQLSFDYSKDGKLIGMSFVNLVNYSHRMSNGKYVTYAGALDDERTLNCVAIGSNKTKKFKTACICFSLVAEPSYNIGELDEDTSLYITLSGKGSIKNNAIKTANGVVTGTLGCGCYAYGHTSPTRLWWLYGVTSEVSDVAAVYGKWSIKLIK